MASILILSGHLLHANQWKNSIGDEHNVYILRNSRAITRFIQQPLPLLIVDAEYLQSDNELQLLKNFGLKILLIGKNWSEDRQITVLVSGIAGYCESKNAVDSLSSAANSILQGDIWVQRHLVPKIIERLIYLNSIGKSANRHTAPVLQANLHVLTHRELDVANMIRQGENNKMIATALNISERTVKAHLTSIFQKLNVKDRVHLALLLKEIV
ncbi:MAG: response regulator transcription factor [Methylococcales bacterium]